MAKTKSEINQVTNITDADEKLKALEAARLQIEKQFGQGSIMKLGSKTETSGIEVIPSGRILLDEAHSLVQLFAAIASHRTEDIACHARRVDADEHRLVCVQFAFDQYHMFRPVAFLAERNDAETSVLGWQVGLDPLLYEQFCSEAVGNQVAYGDDLDAEFFRDFDQLRHARHRSVFVQDFDQRSGRL